jgi:hypothetical protein
MAVQYDAKEIQRLADSIYSSARITQVICWVIGLLILVASWYVPSYYAVPRVQMPIPKTVLPPEVAWLVVGLVLFIVLVLIGSAIADCIRGRAQLLLCMLQVERNTAAKTATPAA